jgi:hypothetical protein
MFSEFVYGRESVAGGLPSRPDRIEWVKETPQAFIVPIVPAIPPDCRTRRPL